MIIKDNQRDDTKELNKLEKVRNKCIVLFLSLSFLLFFVGSVMYVHQQAKKLKPIFIEDQFDFLRGNTPFHNAEKKTINEFDYN
jgi:hypothetical protein